ncbi:UDP-galactopyranose mutase [Mycoplasma crocodyli]|uniref:UDP-galactopyranose mutase n=1 Tax=Mycoplasma crocodyli (strain ATCC 51981 / MP145) TaxID=512564 RepID=D5E5Z5_MYCCM|nr:UDP-galactopyranose mutase [Mycoplasma crocodyli]ADE19421.1 UDP-galactopyranose mutase [Mycoplasma crocodyli MP145]
MNKKIKIIGAGVSGCTMANLLAEKGYEIELYEQKSHIGGNCYDLKSKKGNLYHLYGPHIFHTKNNDVANYIKKFADFNEYINKPVSRVNKKYINLPVSLESIKQIDPINYKEITDKLLKCFPNKTEVPVYELNALEELKRDKKISKIISWIYLNIYAKYTSKMWGIEIENIDKSVLNRVKILLTNEHNYFPGAILQGLPIGGYTKMLHKMIDNKNIKLFINTDALKKLSLREGKTFWDNKEYEGLIIYTGQIEKLIDFKFGSLPYRSLYFKFLEFNKPEYQNFTIINKPLDKKITRTVEYNKMTLIKNNSTIISHEYPGEYNIESNKWSIPYYPIQQIDNINLYNKYKEEISKYSNILLLGRLAQYKYLDIDTTIEQAFELFNEILKK